MIEWLIGWIEAIALSAVIYSPYWFLLYGALQGFPVH